MLVDGAIHVAPDTVDLDVGLIDEPPVPDTVTARSRCIDEQRCEALDPAIDRDVIDFDATFGQDGEPLPRDPGDNLGIDDIKLRIKACGKP